MCHYFAVVVICDILLFTDNDTVAGEDADDSNLDELDETNGTEVMSHSGCFVLYLARMFLLSSVDRLICVSTVFVLELLITRLINSHMIKFFSHTLTAVLLHIKDVNKTHCIKFGSTSLTVRFAFGLSNSSGSFGLVCLAKYVVSSSVRSVGVRFDSHL